MAILVMLAACGGGASFQGRWSGQMALGSSCTDGVSTSDSKALTWIIMQEGATLYVTPEGGTCDSFTADVAGYIATLKPKECPLTGDWVAASVDSGKLTLDRPGKLLVSIRQFHATASVNCSSTIAGTMSLQ